MLKKQKVKILSIVGATVVGAGVAISTPIAINASENVIETSKTSITIQNAKATTNSNVTNEKDYWIATGLAISYGVIALIIACVAFAFLYKNIKSKKKQKEIEERTHDNLLNEQINISSDNAIQEEIESVTEIDSFLKNKNVKNYEHLKKTIRAYLKKNIQVDHDNPVDIKKYFDRQSQDYLPNIVYLKATPEHNFLFKAKNIISIEKPFDNDKKDILVYDLWSHKITGYAKVVESLETNKKDLYEIIKEFSAFAKKDFDDLYENSKNACLLFCDNIVRFEHPIEPTDIGIESLKKDEEELIVTEPVLVYQQVAQSTPEVVEFESTEPKLLEITEITPSQPIESETIIKEVVFIENEKVNDLGNVVEETIIIDSTPSIIEPEIAVINVNEIDEKIEDVQLEKIEEFEIIPEPTIEQVDTIEKTEVELKNNSDFDNNELAKQTSKIEPVISHDVEIVKPVAKDEIKDIIKANEQTPSEIIREDNEIENKIVYPKFRIKTIIDKQTRKNAPITFLVTKQEKNNISNTYEINNKNNRHNKNQKVAKEYTYNKRKITNINAEMLKKEGKFYKFKPSTHPKVREEQIKIMNDFCEKNNNN